MPYCEQAYLVLDAGKYNPVYCHVIHDNLGSLQLIIAQEGLEHIFSAEQQMALWRRIESGKRTGLKRRKGKVQIYDSNALLLSKNIQQK